MRSRDKVLWHDPDIGNERHAARRRRRAARVFPAMQSRDPADERRHRNSKTRGAFVIGAWPSTAVRHAFAKTPASDRIHETIQKEQEQSEILVSVIQLFGDWDLCHSVYAVAPKGFGADVTFEPVPLTLGRFTRRLRSFVFGWLLQRSLPRWFVAVSIVVDVAVLLITIWSFHLQYDASPALYLKAPTLMYVFILIALQYTPVRAGRW